MHQGRGNVAEGALKVSWPSGFHTSDAWILVLNRREPSI